MSGFDDCIVIGAEKQWNHVQQTCQQKMKMTQQLQQKL